MQSRKQVVDQPPADTQGLSATITRNQLHHQQSTFDRMQQIRRTQQEVSDMIVDRSAAQDRIFDKYSEPECSVDTYRGAVNYLGSAVTHGHVERLDQRQRLYLQRKQQP